MAFNQGKSKSERHLKRSKQASTFINSEIIRQESQTEALKSPSDWSTNQQPIFYEACLRYFSEMVPKTNNILENCIFIEQRLC